MWNLGLEIHTAKTKTMVFEKGRHTACEFYLDNVKLELVTSFKYLGIHFFDIETGLEPKGSQHETFALHYLFFLFKQIELPISEECKVVNVYFKLQLRSVGYA